MQTKICIKCYKRKKNNRFCNKRNVCLQCHSNYNKEYYNKNKVNIIARINHNNILYKQKVLKFLRQHKTQHGCISCGYNQHFAALEFHHKNDNKEFILSKAHNFGWEKILKEINKCDILCSNCHRILHYEHSNSQESIER